MGDEDERSLETRSLPGGSPPLVVDIPEPTLSGPSSDPGRAPSPTSQKVGQVPSMELENEMNRRLFNTRKVWENSTGLSNWSSADSPVVSNVSSTPHDIVSSVMVSSSRDSSNVSVSKSENGETPVSPSKCSTDAPVVSTTEHSINKAAEEKSSVAPGFATTSKRPEQQVCKVKPQQQMPQADETKRLHNSTGVQLANNQRVNNMESMIPNSKYASFIRPDRPNSQSALYTSSDRQYPDQLRLQSFQSLHNHVRSVDQPGSSINQQQQRDLLLSSLQVGNLYNTSLQGSQNVVAWPVVTPPNLQQQQQQNAPQQTKALAYQTTNFRTSLFTSPSLGSSVMMHDSFSSQRSTGNIQRQQVGLVQLPQQQQQQHQSSSQTSSGMIGVIPPSAAQGRTVRRDQHQVQQQQQHYRSLHSDMQLPNNHMALLLTQGSNTLLQQQQQQQQQQMNAAALAQQQQINTDLTKHVNAKPFEPTTQTPPLVQSPPVVQQSVAHPQQQIMSTMFRHSTSTHTIGGNHQNMMNRQNQQIIQQQQHHQHQQQQSQQRQGHIQPLQQQHHQQHHQQQQHNPLIASIRPRSVAQLPTHSSPQSSLPSQDRTTNIPYNQTNLTAMVVNPVGGRRQVAAPPPPQGHNLQHHMQQIPTQVLPTNMQNHYLQNALSQHMQQQQQQSRNLARAPGMPPNRSAIPGPIQRPSQVATNHMNFTSALPAPPPPQSTTTSSGGEVDFKKIQRQKMLEDTKKYFQQEQKSTSIPDKEKIEEKPSMGNQKMVISENELGEKKFNNKKAVQSSKSGSVPQDYQTRNNSRNAKQAPVISIDGKKKHEPTSTAPSSANTQQSC